MFPAYSVCTPRQPPATWAGHVPRTDERLARRAIAFFAQQSGQGPAESGQGPAESGQGPARSCRKRPRSCRKQQLLRAVSQERGYGYGCSAPHIGHMSHPRIGLWFSQHKGHIKPPVERAVVMPARMARRARARSRAGTGLSGSRAQPLRQCWRGAGGEAPVAGSEGSYRV